MLQTPGKECVFLVGNVWSILSKTLCFFSRLFAELKGMECSFPMAYVAFSYTDMKSFPHWRKCGHSCVILLYYRVPWQERNNICFSTDAHCTADTLSWHISPPFNSAMDTCVLWYFQHQQGIILPASYPSTISSAWSFGDESVSPHPVWCYCSISSHDELSRTWADDSLVGERRAYKWDGTISSEACFAYFCSALLHQ